MLTLTQILEALEAATPHALPVTRAAVHGVSTDTRSLHKGDLFVALKGESFDGHDFVRMAIKAGAIAAVVSDDWYYRQSHPRMPVIVVRSTLEAYGVIARTWRRQFKIPVVCVAGSNGKTATKEMTALVLAEKYNVLKTPENDNNQIGVPKTLLQLTKKHTAVVLEIGSNHAGEIASLCRIAEPTHGLITTIGRDHLQYLRTIEGVAGENGDLFGWLSTHDGKAFVNADDKYIRTQAALRGLNAMVEYGFAARTAAIKGKRLGIGQRGEPKFSFSIGGKRAHMVTLQAIGEHSMDNALAAASVGAQLGVPSAKIASALESYVPDTAHDYARLRVERAELDGGRGRVITILNDTYNANPDSMYAALETLFEIKTNGRRIAVLGDMLELGEGSRSEHEFLGTWLLQSDIDEVFLVGEEMFYAYEAVKSNRELALPRSLSGKSQKGSSVRKRLKSQDVATSSFALTEKSRLIDVLFTTLHNDDVVLVKGSRGMKMEDIVVGLHRHDPSRPKAGVVSKSKKKK